MVILRSSYVPKDLWLNASELPVPVSPRFIHQRVLVCTSSF